MVWLNKYVEVHMIEEHKENMKLLLGGGEVSSTFKTLVSELRKYGVT